MYLGQGGKLALPEAGSELIKFYPQIPLLRFNHLFSLNNFLGLKYFLVQSIGFVTLFNQVNFLFRFFDEKSLFLVSHFFWKVELVLFLFYPLMGLGSSKEVFQ